jgi:hypothetical protein
LLSDSKGAREMERGLRKNADFTLEKGGFFAKSQNPSQADDASS